MYKLGLWCFAAIAIISTVEATTTAAVSYNLYWWWVSSNGQFGNLFNVINSQQYDIIGYSECDDMRYVVENTCGSSCDYYNPQGAAMDNAAPMAWSNSKYARLNEGSSVVASDQYGARVLNWVRLQDRSSGAVIFFANTHGPLGQANGEAGTTLANNYINAIESNKQTGDELIFMGDFNVVSSSTAMQILSQRYKRVLTGDSFGGVDHILTNGMNTTTGSVLPGWPSDHSLLRATFEIRGGPPPPPTPAPEPGSYTEFSQSGCSNWQQITISTTSGQGSNCEQLCRNNGSCKSFNVGRLGRQFSNYCSLMRAGCSRRSDPEWDLFIEAN